MKTAIQIALELRQQAAKLLALADILDPREKKSVASEIARLSNEEIDQLPDPPKRRSRRRK